MRLATVLFLLGCENSSPMPDAASGDANIDASTRVCERLTPQQSYSSPVGECCDESAATLCGSGAGVCVVDLCVRQCSPHPPKCPLGGTETWVMRDDGRQCLCVE